MSNSVLIILLGTALTVGALAVHAEPAKAPTIGAANPAPPAAAPDIGQAEPPKPVLGGNAAGKTNGVATDNRAIPPFVGTDTSTAGPGGQAESSANGALSSPPNRQPARESDHREKPAAETGGDTPK